ncbi:MAG TPA: single-stranded-DNA-specific exonuclease RecJ [Candidatus Saccharimonadia bacterium]|nr:single-stranded-DNA-specific exonuclease RecJ [Candidatus Saccharimonadia bacterium]
MTSLNNAATTSPVPEIVARILAGRGVPAEAVADFLHPKYDEHLHDPYLLSDMMPAVERIVAAVEAGEQVVVYGDYDIDGITASAIMLETLAALGLTTARSYIPDRFEEGYGINAAALEQLQAAGAQLVISVDCGITSVAEAEWAREHGLDLIITDHHAVPAVLPEAIAVVNPKRPGDEYPFKDLCGAGVAFKVAQALQLRTGRPAAGHEKWLLDLVALGTVCDVVDLVGENRVLAHYGLQVMRRTRRVGLRALAAVGGVDIAQITAQQLGFVLGPRMNAAGRLEHAARALELVMTADEGRALAIAEELEVLNRQRRTDQDAAVKAAEAMATARQAERAAAGQTDEPVLVLAHADWSHGIVGIVASKLVEKWHKPVLVAQVMGEVTKGSARSTGTFNMVEGLRANADLLTKFGGHFYAAGYTLPTERLDDLRAGLCAYYEASAADTTPPVVEAEARFADLADLNWSLYEQLQLLEPYGAANPVPVLELAGLVAASLSKIGQEGAHLRLSLRDSGGRNLAAIGFGLAVKHPQLAEGQSVTVLGQLNKNEFRGNSTLQLVISDIRYE